MQCPKCNGNLQQSSTDLDVIDIEECSHTFKCLSCDNTFLITFAPIDIEEIEGDN